MEAALNRIFEEEHSLCVLSGIFAFVCGIWVALFLARVVFLDILLKGETERLKRLTSTVDDLMENLEALGDGLEQLASIFVKIGSEVETLNEDNNHAQFNIKDQGYVVRRFTVIACTTGKRENNPGCATEADQGSEQQSQQIAANPTNPPSISVQDCPPNASSPTCE